MSEPTISGSPDATSGSPAQLYPLSAPLTLDEKIDYLYHSSVRIEGKVDWCVQTVNAATQALGNLPFGGGLLKKMGANNG